MIKYRFSIKINSSDKGEIIVYDENANKARKEAIKVVKDAFSADKDNIFLTIIEIEKIS